MSMAAAGFQSPITSQNPDPNTHYSHSQNSDTNSSDNFTFNFDCSFSTKMGSEKANLVGRKPRLVKMRKKLGSENGNPKQFDSAKCDSISGRVSEANRGNAYNSIPNGDSEMHKNVIFNKFDGNVGFASGKSSSDFGINDEFGKFGTVRFEHEANRSGSIPNSNVESTGFVLGGNNNSLNLNGNLKDGSVVFGGNKGSSKLDSNVKNVGFVFGANKGSSKLGLNMENRGFVLGDNKGNSKSTSNVEGAGFVFEASKSSSKLGSNVENCNFVFRANEDSSKLESNVKRNGDFVLGSNNDSSKLNSDVENSSFVVGANKDNSKLDSNTENGGFLFVGNKSDLSQKMGLDEGDLGLGAGKSRTSENGGRVSFASKSFGFGINSNSHLRETAGNFGPGGTNESKKYGHVDFVFSAKKGPDYGAKQSALASDASISGRGTQGTSVGEPGDVECGNSSNKINSLLGSNIEDLGSGKVSEESSTTAFGEFDNFFFVFRARKELASENEQPRGKSDKETLEKVESVARVEQMPHHKPESQKANSSSEKDVNASGRNKPDDKMNQLKSEKDDSSFSSAERPNDAVQEDLVSKLSDEMKRWNINDSERIDGANYTKIMKDNLFANVDINFVFGSNQKTFGLSTEKVGGGNKSPGGKRSKRSKGKLQRQMLATGKDSMSKGGSFQENDASPGCCSPMDFSPYQTSDAAPSSVASERKDATAEQGYDTKGSDMGSEESCSTHLKYNCESYCNSERNRNASTSSSAQDGLSAIRHQYKKKYKLKVGNGLDRSSQIQKAGFTFSLSQSCSIPCNSSDIKKLGKSLYEASGERAELGSEEACENWRIRGNQAYKAGHFSNAEEFYTRGINSLPDTNVSESRIQPLLLCYSNRAATRMSLGRVREALGDCKKAASLDPLFLKVKLRAANCHLVLGEVEDAMLYYNNCLEPETHICLDRRITIEAADGLQKAQKVAEYMCRSVELLQQCSSDAANSALGMIAEALKISCYSEKLFEMKGQALCKLSMYDEVIQVCEQTLCIAEKNFTGHHSTYVDDNKSQDFYSKLWRWCLMSKSHYHLGRLEIAHDLIEKQKQLMSTVNESGSLTGESSSLLAVTIRELLRHKKAGNEAFKSGRHAEAVEHYTAAISKSVDSRPFAAICFCNRAAAHQAVGQIIDAIADCSLAIALDGNYLKAVSRRATLHETIRDYEQAALDIQTLISLLENQSKEEQTDTPNKSGGSVKELQRARNRLSSVQKKVKKGVCLDLYLILGVKASDTESDIKKAYRKAALKHHPDKAAQLLARNDAGDDGKLGKEIVEKVHKDADRLFKIIGEAYGVLSDPEKRLKYNDEEELRDVLRSHSKSNGHSGRQSDFYSSPSERDSWSGRHSDFHGSPFGRSGNRRYWQEDSWRGYSNSRSRW